LPAVQRRIVAGSDGSGVVVALPQHLAEMFLLNGFLLERGKDLAL
jgi:hypothetical protein